MFCDEFAEDLKLEVQREPLKKAKPKASAAFCLEQCEGLSNALADLRRMGVELRQEEIIMQLAAAVDASFWKAFVDANTPFHVSAFRTLGDPVLREELDAQLKAI